MNFNFNIYNKIYKLKILIENDLIKIIMIYKITNI